MRKKIACASAPNHGVNVGFFAAGPGHIDGDELRLDRLQLLAAVQREMVAVDDGRAGRRRQRLRHVLALHVHLPEELEVDVLLRGALRIDVDDEPVGPGAGKVTTFEIVALLPTGGCWWIR